MNNQSQKNNVASGCFLVVAAFIAIAGLVGGYFLFFPESLQEVNNIINRPAKTTDIAISNADALLTGYSFKIIPSCDINNLTINFIFKDNKDKTIVQKSRSMGNVVKGSEYTITFSDISLANMLSISKYNYSVTSGTVTILNW